MADLKEALAKPLGPGESRAQLRLREQALARIEELEGEVAGLLAEKGNLAGDLADAQQRLADLKDACDFWRDQFENSRDAGEALAEERDNWRLDAEARLVRVRELERRIAYVAEAIASPSSHAGGGANPSADQSPGLSKPPQ